MALKRLPKGLTFDSVRNQQSPLASAAPRPAEQSKAGPNEDKEKGRDVEVPEPATPKPDPLPVAGEEAGKIDTVPPARVVRTLQGLRAAEAKGKMTVKGQVSLPADGVSPAFDKIRNQYDEKVAFKHFLGLALHSYADAILAGDKRALVGQPGYRPDPNADKAGVTRAIPVEVFDRIKAALDPLGIMGPTAFSTVILKNALSWYIDVEQRQT